MNENIKFGLWIVAICVVLGIIKAGFIGLLYGFGIGVIIGAGATFMLHWEDITMCYEYAKRGKNYYSYIKD